MSWLSQLFGGKPKQDIQYSTSPQYQQLWGLLSGITPESQYAKYKPMVTQTWQDELMPGIREAYEAKRNPYGGGLSDTPEFANLSKESRNLSSQTLAQAMQDWMGIQGIMGQMAGQPQAYQEQKYNPLAGLLSGAGTTAGNVFSNYMGMRALKDVFGGAGGGGPAGNITNDAYSDFFKQQQPDYLGMGLDAASMIPGPQQPFVFGADMLSKLFK